MRGALALLVALVALTSPTLVGHAAEPPALAPLRFLIGEWEGVGSGKPGEGAGGCTFAAALQGRVVVRTSFAEYPASGDRPAARHDDLMVVYVAADAQVKADYYDNEGHVIRYVVQPLEGGGVVFLSEVAPAAPRFRLTYTPAPDGTVNGRFEIAPPGTPEAFAPYLAWGARRVSPGPVGAR
jgi:hypothetical protein